LRTKPPPFGRIQIDWTKSISRGLVCATAVNNSGSMVELINNIKGDFQAQANIAAGVGGLGLELDGSADEVRFEVGAEGCVNTYPMSMFAVVDLTQATTTSAVCSFSTTGAIGWLWKFEQFNNTGFMGFTEKGKTDFTSALTTPTGLSTIALLIHTLIPKSLLPILTLGLSTTSKKSLVPFQFLAI